MDSFEPETSPQPAPESGPALWNWQDMAWMGGSTLFCLAAGLVGAKFLLPAVIPASLPKDQQNIIVVVIALILEALSIFVSVYFFGLRRRGLHLDALGFALPSPAWLLAGVVFGCLAVPLAGLLGLVIRLALGMNAQNPQTQVLVPDQFSLPAFLSIFILGGLVVPVAEEIFFRAVLFKWLRRSLGFWPAAVISALTFGAAHGEISIAVATGVLGLVLAWVYERSRSLWPAILIHAINNSTSILLLYLALALGKLLPGV